MQLISCYFQCARDLSTFKQLVEHVLDFDALPELRIQALLVSLVIEF